MSFCCMEDNTMECHFKAYTESDVSSVMKTLYSALRLRRARYINMGFKVDHIFLDDWRVVDNGFNAVDHEGIVILKRVVHEEVSVCPN